MPSTAIPAGAASLPKAVVTTYGGLDSVAKVGAVRAAGIDKFFIECYGGIGYPYSDINRMLGQGQVYGIPARSTGPLALVLVAVEAVLGLLLVAGLLLPWSAYAAFHSRFAS